MLILSLLCIWTVAGADTPGNQAPPDEIEKEKLYEQQKLALETEPAEEEARRVAEKIRLTEEMNLTPEQAEALKESRFLEANPGYKDELDDPPTILVQGDVCSDPFIIPESFPYSHSDNTCDYTNQCDIAFSDNSDVIYQLDITTTIDLTVSLCGSSYDTKLAIYTPTCCSGDQDYWQYNDDFCSLQSEITATFTPATYYIVVDGFGTNCGAYTLNITEYVIPTGRCCYGDPYNPDCVDNIIEADCTTQYSGVWTEGLDCGTPCPVPTDCSNAIQVILPPPPLTWPYVDANQTTCGRGHSYDDATCLEPYYDNGEDIIYEITVTEEVTVGIYLTSNTTWTGMAIGTSCPPGPGCLALSKSSGSDETIEGLTLATGTYYLMIDTWSSPDCIDNYTLTIDEYVLPTGRCCYGDPYNPDCVDNVTEDDCLAGYSGTWTEGLDCGTPCPIPPANDDCENAELVAVPSSTQGNTDLANGETLPFCGTSDGAPGVWYRVIGTGNTMTATTCNPYTDFDTKLRVFCHTCEDPYCVGGNDDTSGAPPECDLNGLNRKSTVVWCSEVGTEYLIQVFGFSSYTGNFQLDVFDDGTPCQDPPLCAPPTGACCVDMVCVETNTFEECSVLGGFWYEGEDCTTFECPEPPNIPTLSEWGMIIFTLLLLTAGTIAVIRRRNTVSAKEAARS